MQADLPKELPDRYGFPIDEDRVALAEKVGASVVAIERASALDRFFGRLDALDQGDLDLVKVLQLGDSHIAGDYVTRTIRRQTQRRFGPAGRGFVVADQLARYRGRRLTRRGFQRRRIVDEDQAGEAFGFAGMYLRSVRAGAFAQYRISAPDRKVEIHYQAHPDGAPFEVRIDGESVLELDTVAERPVTKSVRVRLEPSESRRLLEIRALGPNAIFFGVRFESYSPGLLWEAVGTVGADARVYNSLDPESFRRHLQIADPDLVVMMLGGNDALALRQQRQTLDEVEVEQRKLLRAVRSALPEADCLVWGPLDAGERRRNGSIGSKSFLSEVTAIQRRVAGEMQCAFWDPRAAMGGEGSFGRWLSLRLVNQDMVHPRRGGGALLGHLFLRALGGAYTQTEAWAQTP